MPSQFQDGDLIEASHLKQYSGEAYYSAAVSGSTSSAYLATVTPAPLSAYPLGMVVNFKPNADSAASPTLNVNGMGAKAIVKNGATPLAATDLKNGQVVSLVYDGTNFQLVAASAGGGSSVTDLNSLTDVTINSPVTTGQFLRKGSSEWSNSGIQTGDLPSGIDAALIGGGAVSNTEFATLDGVTSSIQTQLNGKASTSHTHAASDIASGQVGLARGGTGADLSATGGAGQVLKQNTAGGAISVGALSASDMPAGIDAAKIGSGAVSNTEFATLDGVTSSIQTQLNGKAATSHTHAASDIASGQVGLARGGTGADLSATGGAGQVLKQNTAGGAISVGALSASDMPAGIDAAKIGAGIVSNTELGYLDGVTSALQTQLNGKAATSHSHAASDITSGILGIARGGTGLSALGSALQSLRVNSAGTALEYFTPSSGSATSYCCVVQRLANKYWGANYVRDAITWDTEILDASGMHSTSVDTDRIYLNRSGNWLVFCSLGFQNTTDNGAEPWFYSHLYKNTTEITGLPTRIGSSGTSEMHTVLVQVVPSNGSDYVQLQIETNDWPRAMFVGAFSYMIAIYLGA